MPVRPVLFVALLLVFGVASSGCQRQEPADRRATGPSGRGFDRQQAEAVQDSLLAILEPGQIAATVSGNPLNESTDEVFSGEPLRGPLAIDSVRVEGDRAVRFALRQSEATPRSRLQIELRYDSTVGAGTYDQRSPGLPTVRAEMHRGRTRYVSRSGELVLRRPTAQRTEGRFFFEMQRPQADGEDDWFEVAGAFRTAPATDTLPSEARR